MERLTENWDEFDTPIMVCEEFNKECPYDDCPLFDCKWYQKAVEKLYKYEETGLEPEEVQELKEQKSDWIPVEERLPEDSEDVMVTFQFPNGIKGITQACYLDTFGIWHGPGEGRNILGCKILAWKPFPKPYQLKENQS